MDQDRMRNEDMPTRSSNMEPAEGSRETVKNSGDLGTSSDRAMFDERNSSSGSGITNRGLDREQSEQDSLPPRGQSQSER